MRYMRSISPRVWSGRTWENRETMNKSHDPYISPTRRTVNIEINALFESRPIAATTSESVRMIADIGFLGSSEVEWDDVFKRATNK